MSEYINAAAHDALNRMKRAHERQTGCHLTADMVAGLGLTFLAETWDQTDPRAASPNEQAEMGVGR